MTWGDDLAVKLMGAAIPAHFEECLATWEAPVALCEVISLADLKAALGIADDSQDAELTRLIGVYSQAFENYLERQICEGAREVVWIARAACRVPHLTIPQYPVVSVEHLDIDGTVYDAEQLAELVFDSYRGVLYPRQAGGWHIHHYLHLKYTAGYDPVPADLEDAAVQLIGTALTSSGAGTTGPLKSQRVEGAVTETFYDPRSSVTESSSGSGTVGQYASTLDVYRSDRAFL